MNAGSDAGLFDALHQSPDIRQPAQKLRTPIEMPRRLRKNAIVNVHCSQPCHPGKLDVPVDLLRCGRDQLIVGLLVLLRSPAFSASRKAEVRLHPGDPIQQMARLRYDQCRTNACRFNGVHRTGLQHSVVSAQRRIDPRARIRPQDVHGQRVVPHDI